MHIGISGPIYIPSINLKYTGDRSEWPIGVGGVPVNHLINALLELGYRLSVFSSSPEIEVGKSFEWHEDNISIYIGPFRQKARLRVFDFFAVERDYLTNTILKAKPDFIHAHWQYEWALGSIDSGIPTLVTCHDSPVDVFKSQPDLYRFFRLIMAFIVLQRSTFLTAVSQNCANGLKLITSKKIEIIPNFEPDDVFLLYKPKQINQNGKFSITMINNGFTKLKNVTVGIRAFVKFRNKHPSAELHLFGKSFGDREEAYLWSKSQISIENIYFHGELPFEALMKELSLMDLFLHTSKQESFGMVLVEAMAMGIPVIAGKNSGGPEWILKDGGGVLVDITDVDDVDAALESLLIPDFYKKTSLCARQIALSYFSKEMVVRQYINAYDRILEKRYSNEF